VIPAPTPNVVASGVGESTDRHREFGRFASPSTQPTARSRSAANGFQVFDDLHHRSLEAPVIGAGGKVARKRSPRLTPTELSGHGAHEMPKPGWASTRHNSGTSIEPLHTHAPDRCGRDRRSRSRPGLSLLRSRAAPQCLIGRVSTAGVDTEESLRRRTRSPTQWRHARRPRRQGSRSRSRSRAPRGRGRTGEAAGEVDLITVARSDQFVDRADVLLVLELSQAAPPGSTCHRSGGHDRMHERRRLRRRARRLRRAEPLDGPVGVELGTCRKPDEVEVENGRSGAVRSWTRSTARPAS
jgi:hypothetical protein